MTNDERFFIILDKIEAVKKCVNKMRIDLDTHLKLHEELTKSKKQICKSKREKIAIIISIAATAAAILSILPPLI